jgi:hypothetical protein
MTTRLTLRQALEQAVMCGSDRTSFRDAEIVAQEIIHEMDPAYAAGPRLRNVVAYIVCEYEDSADAGRDPNPIDVYIERLIKVLAAATPKPAKKGKGRA